MICVVPELLRRVSECPLRRGMVPVAGAVPGPSHGQTEPFRELFVRASKGRNQITSFGGSVPGSVSVKWP